MTPNRVNRAHWPNKENRQKNMFFEFCRSMEKIAWDGPKWGREGLFPANQDLADILCNRFLMLFISFYLFGSMEKIAWDGPKWGQEDLFPTNPDLADMLGRPDSDFENLYFCIFFDP